MRIDDKQKNKRKRQNKTKWSEKALNNRLIS